VVQFQKGPPIQIPVYPGQTQYLERSSGASGAPTSIGKSWSLCFCNVQLCMSPVAEDIPIIKHMWLIWRHFSMFSGLTRSFRWTWTRVCLVFSTPRCPNQGDYYLPSVGPSNAFTLRILHRCPIELPRTSFECLSLKLSVGKLMILWYFKVVQSLS
jgi:hypothetical protein